VLARVAMRRFALVIFFALTACRDHDAEALARARLQYNDLVNESARPQDLRFDEVLKELRTISPTSKHFEAAQKMTEAIEGGRRTVRTPLAMGGNGRPPALEAQLAACARLAQLAGLDGGVDRRALEALEDCRHKAELLELQFAHGIEDGGEEPH